MLDRRIMLLAGALLGVAGTASAQVAPPPAAGAAPASTTPPVTTVPATPPVTTVPATPPVTAAPATPPAPPPAAAGPAVLARPPLDPALVERAREAKRTGNLIDVPSSVAVEGCRDLGSDYARAGADGPAGRARVRVALRRIARARGASHIFFSEHTAGAVQIERGRFFDCTSEDIVSSPPSVAPGAAPPSPPPPVERPEAPSAPGYWGAASLQLDLLPAGLLTNAVDGQRKTASTATLLGVSGAFEWLATPQIAIGLMPGLVFGVKEDGSAGEAATQVDVRARGRFGQLQRDGLGLYGYATVGGSWLVLPGEQATSSGVCGGLGFGLSYPLRNGAFMSFELGYQLGDQSYHVADGVPDAELSTHLVHFGIGLGNFL